MQTINILYLNLMSSLRVLHDSSTQPQLQRFKLKEKLLRDELAKLKIRLAKAQTISKSIKSLLPTFRHPHFTQERHTHPCCKQLLKPIAQQLQEIHKLLDADNASFEEEVEEQEKRKRVNQASFMQMMRGYEAKMTELDSKIKLLENSLQYYSSTNNIDEQNQQQEDFSEDFSSLPFLEKYLTLHQMKQTAISDLFQTATSRNIINSQIYCNSERKIDDPESLAESILLKEKIVCQSLKDKITYLRTRLAVEKNKMQRFGPSIKCVNALIGSMNLQASINGCNNFLLEEQHYGRHWRNMKTAVEQCLLRGLPQVNKKLVRSKSCTVMQSSQIGEDNTSIAFDRSTSIQKEESFLDNLEYFVSQNFIKDLIDHQL